jgi:hypothetical protein
MRTAGTREDLSQDAAMSSPSLEVGPDRRLQKAFRIELNLHYALLYGTQLGQMGSGKTLHISRSEVRFTAEGPLAVGTPLTLCLAWPALLNGECPLQLVVYGCIARSEEKAGHLLKIEHYEFRTASPKRTSEHPG